MTQDLYDFDRAADVNIVYQHAERIANTIKQKINSNFNPSIGIICGSGLYSLSGIVEKNSKIVIPYDEIPELPKSKVEGHFNSIIIGQNSNQHIICFEGRCHFYEGYPLWKVTLSVRVMKILGVKTLFITNCCGAVNPDYSLGDIVIIKDHISMPGVAGFNPLVGENDERWGTRFPHLFDAYNMELRKLCARAVKDLGLPCYEGVYCMFCGPSYQTRAEGKMVHINGGDLVGMSTAPEVVVANHCGIKVCALSLIASRMDYYQNINHDADYYQNGSLEENGDVKCQRDINHNGVVEIGIAGAIKMAQIIEKVISKLNLWKFMRKVSIQYNIMDQIKGA